MTSMAPNRSRAGGYVRTPQWIPTNAHVARRNSRLMIIAAEALVDDGRGSFLRVPGETTSNPEFEGVVGGADHFKADMHLVG